MNLKQYRRIDGKWQFVAGHEIGRQAQRQAGRHRRRTGQFEGRTFYLDWREDGKRRTQAVGTAPCEALDAWMPRSEFQAGEIDAPREPAGADKRLTIEQAIQDHLVDVRATKGEGTFKAYLRCLRRDSWNR